MMIVLLLLGASGCMGLFPVRVDYGDSHYFLLRTKANVLAFHPDHNTNVTILWKKGERSITMDGRFITSDTYFTMHKLTEKDNGRYVSLDKDLKEIAYFTLEVKATTKDFEREPGERFSFSYRLEPDSCNVYFFPSGGRQPRTMENEIIRHGLLQGDSDELYCTGFEFLPPCGISNNALQISCNGSYEIRDAKDNVALAVTLEMTPITSSVIRTSGQNFNFTFNRAPNICNIYFLPDGDRGRGGSGINLVYRGLAQQGLDFLGCKGSELLKPCGILNRDPQMSCNGSYEIRDQNDNTDIVVLLEMRTTKQPNVLSAVGIALAVTSMLSSCCRTIYRCGKSDSNEEQTETPAAEPEVQYQGCPNEPGADQPIVLSETNVCDPPSSTLSDSLKPPTPYQDLPPSCSEVVKEPQQPAAPTVPNDPEPTFEFQGMTFPCAPPLEADAGHSDVYTSDKLNFL